MTTLDTAAARVLEPLSELLHRHLSLAPSDSPKAFKVRTPVPRLTVVAEDDRPFSNVERKLVVELFEIVRRAEESELRFSELERRMLGLQRENLDLTVKNRELSEVSSRDALTGLFNRSYVVEQIDSELNRALRFGSPMSVLMLDIDHFKRINDTWGHAAGDEVLKTVGRLLRESCRVYDVPGRYGGEEFCIMLPETLPGNTAVVAERIRNRLESTPLPCGSGSAVVTASFGIAGMESADAVLSASALIERADRALYAAKNQGRNRVETWDDALLPERGVMQH
jgi:diguanylate cyclase (GGDEF)-like protein